MKDREGGAEARRSHLPKTVIASSISLGNTSCFTNTPTGPLTSYEGKSSLHNKHG